MGNQSDDDAAHLYKMMNVEPQDSFIGPGKSIVTANKDLNFVCGSQPGKGPVCSIIFNASSRVKADPNNKIVTYRMTGVDAQEMSAKWNLSGDELNFVSTDNKFTLHVSGSEFQLKFSDTY